MKVSIKKAIIVVVALVGLGIMIYLTYSSYSKDASFCNISDTVSCDVVTTSIYSQIFGIPISLLGGLFFLLILYLSWKSPVSNYFSSVFYLTLLMLIPSLYFTLTEALFIKSYCVLCETSKVMMAIILVTAYFGLSQRPKLPMILPIIITGIVLSGVIYFAQTGTVVKRDYTELVACLNEKGLVYYKSFKCSSCRKFELIMGEAYNQMNQVECHPDGKNAQVQLCLDKKIDKTPTYILEPNQVEIRRLVGLQQPKALADFAGCPLEIR